MIQLAPDLYVVEGEWFDRAVRKGLRALPRPMRWKVQNMFYGPRTPTCRDHFFPWALERRGEVSRPSMSSASAARPAAESRAARPSGRVAVAV